MGLILSDTPQARNVSVGTLVEFTCATPETGLTLFTFTTTPPVIGSIVTTYTNESIQLTFSFIAPVQHSIINIACIAIKGSVVKKSIAVLMIQGEPVSYCLQIKLTSAKLISAFKEYWGKPELITVKRLYFVGYIFRELPCKMWFAKVIFAILGLTLYVAWHEPLNFDE